MAPTSSTPARSRPSTSRSSRSSKPPSAPPPSLPLPPLPPPSSSSSGPSASTSSSPQLPPLPPLPPLVAPSPSMVGLASLQRRRGDEAGEGQEEEAEGGGEESRGKTVGWGAAAALHGAGLGIGGTGAGGAQQQQQQQVDVLEALESPASSHFSSTTGGTSGRETVSTRPSSADSGSGSGLSPSPKFTAGTIPLPFSSPSSPPRPTSSTSPPSSPVPKPRLERAKSVTVDGFDFDFVTPHLAPASFSSAGAGFVADKDAPPPPRLPLPPLPLPPLSMGGTGGSTSPPDTPTAEGEATTPRALMDGTDCGCSEAPLSPSSPEEDEGEFDDDLDDYDEEAERLLAEAGLGGLGLGLLRRQSEALQLARAAGAAGGAGGRGSIALMGGSGGGEKSEGMDRPRAATPMGFPLPPPPAANADGDSITQPVLSASAAAVKLLRRRKEREAKLATKAAKKERRKSKEDFERDRFELPTREEVEAARRCELVGEGGVKVTFEQLLRERKRKVVVIFLRHAWCGLCAQFVEALTKAHRNLDTLAHSSSAPPSLRASISDDSTSTAPSSSNAPDLPPLYVLLISNGSATLIPTYRSRLETPFPLYMDRSRALYKALGMTRKTWDMGSDADKGSYIVKSQMGNITSSISAGIAMPSYPGSQTQLGGEFVFEYDAAAGEVRCNYAARMHTTRAHSEIRDIFVAAGVQLNDADAASVYGGK
ncbi:hypothetical protein JCM6882_002554 [Rhodosporidiobolus microsporus]